MGDITAHGGTIVLGCFTVLIGETGAGAGTGNAPEGQEKVLSGFTGALQAKDIANAEALKKAAKNGDDTAAKTSKKDYTAKFTLVDEAGKAVSGKEYEIRTSDGQVHDGKTNNSGETEELSGYTTADCSITFLK